MTEEKKNNKEDKKEVPDLKPGMLVRVHQKIQEEGAKGEIKERTQVFEGLIIAKRGGKATGTFTVRKIAAGNVGVEKIFPINLPSISKIEIVKEYKIKRAKLYYLRTYNKKLKEKKSGKK